MRELSEAHVFISLLEIYLPLAVKFTRCCIIGAGLCGSYPKPVASDYVRCMKRDPDVFTFLRDTCKAID
jgi:hypothetical protein